MKEIKISEPVKPIYTGNKHIYKSPYLPKIEVTVNIDGVGEILDSVMSDIFVAVKAAIEYNNKILAYIHNDVIKGGEDDEK